MKSLFILKTPVVLLCFSLAGGVHAEPQMKTSANVTIFGANTAFTLPQGDKFVSATIADPRGGVQGEDIDGDLAFGAGFGNPF